MLSLGTGAGIVSGAGSLDETLRESVRRRRIPAAVAMAATAERTTYTGSFGKRDSSATVDLRPDSIFRIDGRPTAQWSRLKAAGYSDDLGPGRR